MPQKSRPPQAKTANRTAAPSQKGAGQRHDRPLLLAAMVLLVAIAVLGWAGGQEGSVAGLLSGSRPEPSAKGKRIGIIAGHGENDSGAVCEDGRTEAETVARIAEKTARRLERAGAEVDVLAEYDDRLNGYVADALVSIHADSCIDRSGFKVARASASTKQEVDDFLVGCLGARYAETTGLTFDVSTITADMTEYHAFKRVASSTPAAIIETGYLGGDWPIIGEQPDLVARGLADGVICYLEGLQQ